MPEEPNTPRSTRGAPQAVDLHAAVISLVAAVLAARAALDQETARLAAAYQRDDVLRQFPLPAFGMGEVTLRLPYAAAGPRPAAQEKAPALEAVPHMWAQIHYEALAQLPPHAVGSIEVKLSQQQLALLLEEGQLAAVAAAGTR